MILNDIFMLPTSRPDLEVCTKFGTPGVFAGPRVYIYTYTFAFPTELTF